MASPLKLTFAQILAIAEALPSLDGYMQDGKATPFKFDHNTRWNYGKDLEILSADSAKILKDRDAKIRELSPVNLNISKETKEIQDEFHQWNSDYVDTEIEVNGILKLRRSKLFANDNPIPGSVISILMPIVENDCDENGEAKK